MFFIHKLVTINFPILFDKQIFMKPYRNQCQNDDLTPSILENDVYFVMSKGP